MSDASADPMIGRLLDGRYLVRSRIARGGMATVYVATDERLERRVAIKIMHGHLADDNAFKSRFVQEARSAARLGHPNVVNVYDQGADAGLAYLVMEYLPGITLRDLLKDYKRLTAAQTYDITEAVLAGLAAAHQSGIIHRDLKPENVLLADDGRIKIGDFGLARAVTANTASGQALLGTIAYLSPELVTRGVADTRSDIYAIGIMMYEMLTGEQPFKGEQPMQIAYQHANDRVPAPSAATTGSTPELDELVAWATSPNPADRPADAQQMLDRLRILRAKGAGGASTTTVIATPTAVLPPISGTTAVPSIVRGGAAARPANSVGNVARLHTAAAARRRRGRWLFAAVSLLAVLAGGVGWYVGAGPGANAAVPDVLGQPFATAAAMLEENNLTAGRSDCPSLDVPVDYVVSTEPIAGTHLPQGREVTLCVSTGPRELAVPQLVGLPEAEAQAAIEAQGFAYDPNATRQFDDAQPAGVVLQALGEGDADLPAGAMYTEAKPIRLLVSAGPRPQVSGANPADAQAALEQAGLVVDGAAAGEAYSDTIAQGLVIDYAALDASVPLRQGASVALTVSLGPELFPVPDVVGMSIPDARQTLEDAGFAVRVNSALPEIGWGLISAASTNPAAGTMVRSGTEITVQGNI